MQKKDLLVLTSIAYTRELYQKYNYIIEKVFNKYKIKILKTEPLSRYAKDYFFYTPDYKIKLLNNLLDKNKNKNVDIFIQKNIHRKKRIIACDMDMTVINVESINLIAKHLLKNDDMKLLTAQAMSGKIKFKESILLRTKKLKGLHVKKILPLLKLIKFSCGIKEVVKTLNKNNCHTMLISGGYDIIANPIGQKIGFKEIISNKLQLNENKITGDLKNNIIDREGKLSYFKKRVKENKIDINKTIAVGDGDNDISMLKYSSLGVAWKAYPKVKKIAEVSLNKSLRSILFFQGYKDKDIINN